MQTHTWDFTIEREPSNHHPGTVAEHVREISAALIATGGRLDWTREFHEDERGKWRLPSKEEMEACDRLYTFEPASDWDVSHLDETSRESYVVWRHGTPHGWANASVIGLPLSSGDQVHIELTSHEPGRHLIESTVTCADGPTHYQAVAHLSPAQNPRQTLLTRDELRALVADPAALPPQRLTHGAALHQAEREEPEELHALRIEYWQRAAAIFAKRGMPLPPNFNL